jgi:hypothetical protein
MHRPALALAVLLAAAWPAAGAEVAVNDGPGLARAISAARAGHVITLLPGAYKLGTNYTNAAGTEAEPIVVRAERLGDARVTFERSRTQEGIVVRHPHWRFENIDFDRGDVEHVFHIVGSASHIVIRHNRMVDFAAAIKANGLDVPGGRAFPNDVLIENNFIYNRAPFEAGVVTPIDVVGGRRWIVRGNFIADFAKRGGDGVAYGGSLKGNAKDGVFVRNLVMCEWRHKGGIRIGLSLGGGGSGGAYCEDKDCSTEHERGTMRNNIIMHCPNDVGIYLNKARNTRVLNNTIYNAYGIDIRFRESSAEVRNNIVAGGVRSRDDGVILAEGSNLVAGYGFGNGIPGATRYVVRRLEGQDAKYPSLISPGMVRWAQETVTGTMEWLGASWLARGRSTLRDRFAAPDVGDFRLRDASDLTGAGVALPTVTDDFCGRPRKGLRADIGAIEYTAGACDVMARLRDLELLEAMDALPVRR